MIMKNAEHLYTVARFAVMAIILIRNQHTSSSGIFRLDHNMQGSEVYDRSKEKILRCIYGHSISKTNVNYIEYLYAASANIFI